MLNTLLVRIERLSVWLAGLGAVVIVIQMLWISYGVFMRYVMSKPDGTVTEATALLLFPVAFLGLGYALREDAYPRVSFLSNALGRKGQRWLQALNLGLMFIIGVFFSITAVSATMNSFSSGAASEILLWPRYLFWVPSALALVAFTAYVLLKLAVHLTAPESTPAMRGEEN